MLALTQGDPVGVGPEILLKAAARWSGAQRWTPVLIAERSALEALRESLTAAPWDRLRYLSRSLVERADPGELTDQLRALDPEEIPVLDPIGTPRSLELGNPGPADARASLAALDLGLDLVKSRVVSALITAPVNKATIARWEIADFRGHTDYLARKLGALRYGRDYLMAFLSKDLRVALLTTHVPLRRALEMISMDGVVDALRCMQRNLRPARSAGAGRRSVRIAVAGLNPHAGEQGLLGSEDQELLEPAVRIACSEGLDVVGPESADTVFYRARSGEVDWVLALYHDQGLIPIKTLAFGSATNWTLGLPVLRTSVDHGTAYAIAGRGEADAEPLWSVIQTTLELAEQRPECAEPFGSPRTRRGR